MNWYEWEMSWRRASPGSTQPGKDGCLMWRSGLQIIFACISGQTGDTVTLNLDMPVRVMVSHPRIRANSGRICLMKGPLVYCFEEADNGTNLGSLFLRPDASIQEVYDPDLLGGTLTLSMEGSRITEEGWDDASPYRPFGRTTITKKITKKTQQRKAIPYCLWNNRGEGEMLVWIHLMG